MVSTQQPPSRSATVAERIRRAMEHLWHPGAIHELRILGSGHGVISGLYDEPAAFARDAAEWDGKAKGIYWTINPVDPASCPPARNRVQAHVPKTTSDEHILRRLFLPVDIDPVRAPGFDKAPATSDEHTHTLVLQGRIAGSPFMSRLGFAPPIEIDSGNGAYLLYPIDLPNDETSRELVRSCLLALAAKFDYPAAKVDTSTHNASRILRVPGTMNCKGEASEERPHRRAFLTLVPRVQL